MNESMLPTSELLLQQVSWMRSLAQQLVSDAHLADDLAQETLVKALESPPRDETRLRGWLQTVMRNLLREHVRQRESRTARESERTYERPDEAELVERVHTQRRVAECLLELDEPYRTAILLRFYEDLPPRSIAERLGTPVATVKSRLHRGLATLRERLDSEYGVRSNWVTALIPFANQAPLAEVSPTGTAAASGGGAGLQLTLAAALLVVGGGGALWWFGRESAPREPIVSISIPATPNAPASAELASSTGQSVRVESATRRSPDKVSATGLATLASQKTPNAIEPVTHTVRGRAFDSDGQPVSGVRVQLEETGEGSATAAGGVFEFNTSETRGRLRASSERWAAIRTGEWTADAELDPVLVIAPSIDIEGTVINEWGRSLEGARVALVLPDDFETRFQDVLDASYQTRWSEASEDDGGFSLIGIPAVTGATLRVTHDRYEPVSIPAPLDSQLSLEIALPAPHIPNGRALRGVVIRDDGSPAEGAHVALGFTSVRCETAGQFAINLDHAGAATRLMAVEAGHLPATLNRPDEPNDRSTGWPDFVELRLGPPALSITGKLVDERGRPLEGGRVWVAESTSFGVIGSLPIRLEALMAGGQVPDAAIESLAESDTPKSDVIGSATPQFAPDAMLYFVESNSDGIFELPGLAPQDYVLNVLDRDLHWGAVSNPIAAGSKGAQIVVPTDAVYERVRGRVITDRGDPLEGVRITPWVAAFEWRDQVRAGNADVMRFLLGQSQETDAEGRFELARVPRQHIQFYVVSDETVPSYASVDQIEDPEDFDIRVLARVHLSVELATFDSADAFRVKNGAGELLTLLEMRADGYSNYEQMPLVNGRSGFVSVTSDATTVELLKAGSVVDSVAITPRPGQPITLQR